MSLDPARLTRELVDEYSSYLRSRFFFKDQRLQRQFAELLDNERRLYSGPYLELTPPFRPGATPRQLVESGVFHTTLLRIAPEALHPDRPLYVHQQYAIEKIQAGRNAIVATGTGSGKTESYLLPIVDHILANKRNGEAGVRALLVYPMNALANDQLKRLRELLRATPEVTFGRYTGETPTDPVKALARFRETWPREPVLANELKSREEMWAKSPDILITNFAMLEYLLVRPQDASIFGAGTADTLRFLVLDEVHTYDGAKGAEIGMLMRRLKERAGFRGRGALRCIGTSATLGGPKDLPDIAEFASQLFDEQFEYDATGGARDVVEAERNSYRRPSHLWCPSDDEFYAAAADTFLASEVREDAVLAVLDDSAYAVPPAVRQAVISALAKPTDGAPADVPKSQPSDDWGWDAAPPAGTADPTEKSRVARALFELLQGEERMHRLRELCAQRPLSLHDAKRDLFPGLRGNEGRDALLALVAAGGRAMASADQSPLLRARYHLFLRALEGGFVCLKEHGSAGEPKLFLERRVTCDEHGEARTFEVGACRRCGEPMLVGSARREPSGFNTVTSEDPTQDQLLQEAKPRRIVLAFATAAVMAANEDESDGEDQDDANLARLRICRTCGVYGESGEEWICLCEGPGDPLDVIKVPPGENGDIKLCPSCGSRSRQRDVLQTLYTGPDEPVAEIATTTYQTVNRDYAAGRDAKRKLLTFSDSRQDAAYFAPYLEGVYRGALRRHVILKLLADDQVPLPLVDLASRLTGLIEQKEWMGPAATPEQLKAEAWRWVVAELLHGNRTRRGLEELGLVGFELRRFPDVPIPPALQRRWQMDEVEAWTLVQVLLDSLRGAFVFKLPEGIRTDDPVFAPARAGRSIALRRADNDRRTLSWIPQLAHLSNSRLDYLTRLAAARGLVLSREDLAGFLQSMFEKFLTDPNRKFVDRYFDRDGGRTQGVTFQLAHRGWAIRPPQIIGAVFRCSRCGIRTLQNLNGVCPTYRCDGELRKQGNDRSERTDHYRDRYLAFNEIWMVAREHTAQLDSLTAAGYQNLFMEGGIDVLSCSTTFELGVDLGELESILMRNVPPTPANYAQRAGRAGRRLGGAAYVVTYAQRRSHDLTYYNAPLRMISGRVRPPSFRIDNEKIVRRHVYAEAFAALFRETAELFGSGAVSSLFGDDGGDRDAVSEMRNFLARRPSDLGDGLKRIVPRSLHSQLGIADWAWADELISGRPLSIETAQVEYRRDCDYYRALEREASAAAKHKRAGLYQYIRRTIQSRQLLGVLANRGLYPKYGFPVDVVGLEINPDAMAKIPREGRGAQLEDFGLELQRDLKLAIADYAPGSEVVAGGYVWTSAGLKVLPDRRLEEISYLSCRCGAFRLEHPEDEPTPCPFCGASASEARPGRYIRPEYGFVTSSQPPRPVSTRKPTRQHASRTAFANYVDDVQPEFTERWVGVQVDRPRPARLVSINSGKGGRGFRFCQQCGFAAPSLFGGGARGHDRPDGRPCKGSISAGVALGHDFITDVLELRLNSPRIAAAQHWWSIAYALAEGSSLALGIKREDIDVVVRGVADGGQSVFIFDSVPGGAGHTVRIAQHLGLVLRDAHHRVANCACEERTSCYECLRTYSNQRLHSSLNRGVARDFLARALGKQTSDGPPRTVTREDVLDLISDLELRKIVERLLRAGAPLPEIGFEYVDDTGRVIGEWEVAWPHVRVAVDCIGSSIGETPSDWRVLALSDVGERPKLLAELLGITHG